MEKKVKVAIIGLDTSHSVEFPKLMLDPTVDEKFKINTLLPTYCLRFETPFQNKEGLDKRQEYLESIGLKVTEDFDVAVSDCDVIMLEINDPTYHLEYFTKCAKLGKPIFLDKPVADSLESAKEIYRIAKENNVKFFSTSSLRYMFDLSLIEGEEISSVTTWGALGKAPAGSSIIWYGVHAFEILQTIMGKGATTVTANEDSKGYVCTVNYSDGRRGVVQLERGAWTYLGVVYTKEKGIILHKKDVPMYAPLIKEVEKFFLTGEQIVDIEDSFEVISMLDAAQRSANSGKPEVVYTCPKEYLA